MRIVSLLASGTELACALGAGDDLVGRSHECDHPPWVTRLPALTRPTFDVAGSSGEIDAAVRARLRAGEPLYEVDEARLADLRPDVIITQTHCEVCAVSLRPDAAGAACRPALDRRRVVDLRGGTLDEILASFVAVAEVIGRRDAGERLVRELGEGLARRRAAIAGLERPTVVGLEWIDPPYVMSNWAPELIEAAGGRPRLGARGAHSTPTTWQAVREADPDVLVVAPCGFSLERTMAEMPQLAARPGWSELRAVRAGRVFAADGNLYFNRSSPSLFATVDVLAEVLHPETFRPALRGSAWRPWPS
jgi:iron complex transport system substrate-binding protein